MTLLQVPNSVFLQDFGQPVVWGALSTIGTLDMPTQEVLGHTILTTDYRLIYDTATLPGLDAGAAISVGGIAYVVRSARMLSDGVFSEAIMSKV